MDGIVLVRVSVSPTVQNDERRFHAAKVAEDSMLVGPNHANDKTRRAFLVHFQLGTVPVHCLGDQMQAQARATFPVLEP